MDYYDSQVFAIRNLPGASLADGELIDRWPERARADDRNYITRQVTNRRAANQAKAKDALARIDQLQDQLVAIRKQAERNEVPWTELAKLQKRLVNERITLEKVLESLEASEASNVAMAEDPTAYLSEFYSRFPTLRDRRPNLAADLAEDQRKRGVASLL